MKKRYLATALVAAFVGSAQAESFLYSFQVNNLSVTGSFDGAVNGDLVTNLSNITAAIDGIAFSGFLYGVHYEGWDAVPVSGGAVASFSGAANNFLFIDVNFPHVGGYRTFVDFTSIQGSATANYASAYMSGYAYQQTYLSPTRTEANWRLTHVSAVPEPETYAMLLAGLGLIGTVARRRKQKATTA